MKKVFAVLVGFCFAGIFLALLLAFFSPKIYVAHTVQSVQTGTLANPATEIGPAASRAAGLFNSAGLLQSAQHNVTAPTGWFHYDRVSAATVSDGQLQVEAYSTNPQRAESLLDSALQVFGTGRTKLNAQLYQQQAAAAKQQIQDSTVRLQKIDSEVAQIEKQSGIVGLDDTIKNFANYQATLNAEKDQATNDLAATSKAIIQQQAQVKSLRDNVPAEITQTASDEVNSMTHALAELEAKRVNLLGTWKETAPPIQDIDAQIAAAKAKLADAKVPKTQVQTTVVKQNPQKIAAEQALAQSEVEQISLKARLAGITEAESRLKTQSATIPDLQTKITDIQRNRASSQSEFDTASQQLSDLRNGKVAQAIPALSPVFPVQVNSTPVWPSIPWFAGIGGSVGFCLGLLGLVLTRGGEPEGYAHGPTPAVPSGTDAPALPTTSVLPLPATKRQHLEPLALPETKASEAYRFMVFALQGRTDLPIKILFTAASSDSLGAEVAAQFAIAMAQTGVKTLLADANLRHRELTKAFQFGEKSGISDMLSKTMLPVPGSDLLLETAHSGLYFLSAGSEDEVEGLSAVPNQQIAGLLSDLDNKAEVTVINTAPCTVVSDASRIVRHVDLVCLVASKHDQRRGLVEKATEILTISGAPSIELVLVDSQHAKNSFLG